MSNFHHCSKNYVILNHKYRQRIYLMMIYRFQRIGQLITVEIELKDLKESSLLIHSQKT
jgi:hypothetical protein